MKTHLLVVNAGGMDPLANMGPASRSGRIFLRLTDPLPEGENVVLKLLGSGDRSYLLDGIIVSCTRIQNGRFHVQADVTQSIASLFLEMENKSAAPLPSFGRAGTAPAGSPAKTAMKTPAKAAGKMPDSSATIIDMPEMENIGDIEEISDIDIIEVSSGPTDFSTGGEAAYAGESSLPPSDGALGMEDIRQIVSQEEVAISPDAIEEKPSLTSPVTEKKTLTEEERKKAEPVGKFLMNLTKAMSRSGYYEPGHPSAASAKKGLYEEFIRNAGEYNEIVFTREKTRETLDIFITGVLDEQVSVRMLVGQGVAELFLPKLSDYYDRKGLLSFVIRKEITLEHFDLFIDIMSDPKVDQQDSDKAGALLTGALVDKGITEISAVFVVDRIELGLDLPWRVEMAIQRLAKDFKTMPLFKGLSEDAIKQLKMQTVADILRPLKHPRYYSEFLVNCHIIAREVKGIDAADIENIIVDAFPLEQLIPTSHFTFDELGRLEKRHAEDPEASGLAPRLNSIRRVLKMVARRVAVDRPKGAVHFLADLYKNAVLPFEDLPPEAQYLVNSRRLADDIASDFAKYERHLRHAKTPEDVVVCLKSFRRAAPILIEEKGFNALVNITGLIADMSSDDILQADDVARELEYRQNNLEMAGNGPSPSAEPDASAPFFAYLLGDSADMLIEAFSRAGADGHKQIGKLLGGIGLLGIQVLSRILAESKNKDVRKHAVETMIRLGDLSRKWALQVLGNKKNPWYLHRNAMMILRHVSRHPEDFEIVRMYSTHENARLREEIIGLIIALRPSDAESLIIGAIDDPEPKIRWRATRSLADISPISGTAMNEILEIIASPPARGKDAAAEHRKKIANLISAINGMPDIPASFRVETEINRLMESLLEQEKAGVLKIFKRGATLTDEDIGVIKASIPLLARIGTTVSEAVLSKISRQVPHLAESIDAALAKIKKRQQQ